MPDHLEIAFEVLDINGIESDDRGIQSNIGFSNLLAKKVWPSGVLEDLLEAVE